MKSRVLNRDQAKWFRSNLVGSRSDPTGGPNWVIALTKLDGSDWTEVIGFVLPSWLEPDSKPDPELTKFDSTWIWLDPNRTQVGPNLVQLAQAKPGEGLTQPNHVFEFANLMHRLAVCHEAWKHSRKFKSKKKKKNF